MVSLFLCRLSRTGVNVGVSAFTISHTIPKRVCTHSVKRYLVTTNTTASEDSNSNHNKARIVFLGTPDVAATTLQTLVHESRKENSPYAIVSVVTQPPKRRKRRGKEEPSPVGLMADQLQIPVLCPEKAKDEDFLTLLETQIRPDLCITAAYGQYLPKRFLGIPKFGTLNIHPSLLPRWRGASPVQRSLEAGDNPVGVSVLFTVSKMDAGPIVSQTVVAIDDDKDTASTLLPRLFHIGTQDLLHHLPQVLNGTITIDTAMKQDESQVVQATMIDSSEGRLRVWEQGARMCHNKVRAFSIWPGTFMYFSIGENNNEPPIKVKIISTLVFSEPTIHNENNNDDGGHSSLNDDTIVPLGPKKDDGLRITCGDGSILQVFQVQPATRNIMDAKSFVNGLRGQTLRWVQFIEPPAADVQVEI